MFVIFLWVATGAEMWSLAADKLVPRVLGPSPFSTAEPSLSPVDAILSETAHNSH